MAIRKFRKNMKPVIWVITIFFLISLVAGYSMSFRAGSGQPQVAFKINGKKVPYLETQRTIGLVSENYNRYLGTALPEELVGVLGFNEVINKELTLEMAKDLKIKIPSSEVKAEIEKIEANFPSKDAFKQAIFAQGYTTSTFEKEIEESLMLQKVMVVLNDNAIATEDEILAQYEQYKYSAFEGKELDEVKDQIIKNIKTEKSTIAYGENLEKAKKAMKLENILEVFVPYQEKKEFDIDGVDVTNVEFAKKVLGVVMYTNGDIEKAKELAKDSLEKDIKLINLAKNQGIVVNENLPLEMMIMDSTINLYEKLQSEVQYTDEQLKSYFEDNRVYYDIQKTAAADVAMIKIEPSEEDKIAAKNEAEKLLKEATKENFADLAKKYSDCPSANVGGSLGTFERGAMVKPFEDAAFSGEVGKIYPSVVETQFGYHIIYVENKEDDKKVTASHILITPKASEKTLNAEKERVQEMVDSLAKETITFDDLKNEQGVVFAERLTDINANGYIPGLGYNEELTKNIFANEVGKVLLMTTDENYVIYKKVSQVDDRKVDFSEVKDRVIRDYKNMKAQEEFRKLQESVETKEDIKVEIQEEK